MASPEAYSRLSQTLTPALEKIINNASWRKHSNLAHQCKSVLEKLAASSTPFTAASTGESEEGQDVPGPLHDGGAMDYSLADSEVILSPLIGACGSGVLKIAEPALNCVQRLIAYGYVRGEADSSGGEEGKLLAKLIEGLCKCTEIGDEGIELLVLKTLLSAVTSVSIRIHGDCLLLIVRTCYDIYLESKIMVNQLIQMLVIVFRRMEADSSTVPVQPIVVAELMEPPEKVNVDASMTVFVQGFITKIVQDIDVVLHPATPGKALSRRS